MNISNYEEIEGKVTSIRYRNEDNGWTVFYILYNNVEQCVTGTIPAIEKNDYVSVKGERIKSKKYGEQIKADVILITLPQNAEDIKKYLVKNIQGVGVKTAQKIIDEYGKDTFTILGEHPEKIQKISKINKKRAQNIAEQFKTLSIDREKQMFYIQIGLTNAQINAIEKSYGEDAREKIQQNPYQLIDDINGIGFKKADDIGLKFGIKKDSPFRVKAALVYFLEQFAVLQGHIYYQYNELIDFASTTLSVEKKLIEDCIKSLLIESKLKLDGKNIYLSKLYNMEINIAEKLVYLLNGNICDYENEDIQIQQVKEIERDCGRKLDDTQREAVLTAINNNVSIITGGPGVGKTTTLDIIIQYYKKYVSDDIVLLAPTGRAAKRMSEQTGMESFTIHRMCGVETTDEIEEIDADVVIVDEMSMVDIYVMNMLIDRIPYGCKLIMVGDVDQLPSVGPGLILKDIINSEIIKTTKLTTIHRQDEDNQIVTNAHKINKGEKVNLSAERTDFCFLRRNSEESCLETIADLYTKIFPKHLCVDFMDIQILTPTKKGELGTINLNKVIQSMANPYDETKNEIQKYGCIYREGDKVMHIKNNYYMEWELLDENENVKEVGIGVFNGEIGYIKSINKNEKTIIVKYDDKQCEYGEDELDELTHAYAITVHKSQGSEFPCVIMPLFYNYGKLFNKNLLYTAITRAKDNIFLLGKTDSFYTMVNNNNAIKRYTSLQNRLIEAIK